MRQYPPPDIPRLDHIRRRSLATLLTQCTREDVYDEASDDQHTKPEGHLGMSTNKKINKTAQAHMDVAH